MTKKAVTTRSDHKPSTSRNRTSTAAVKMTEFPKFMRKKCNAVKMTRQAGGLKGYVFEGTDGTQIVFWQGTQGGTSVMHTHDYDEYAIVVQGTFTGTVGGKKVTLKAGDECFIPAGVPHDGTYSEDYRAIDAFGGQRVARASQS